MEGDDKARFWTGVLYPEFLSTPSGWRATPQVDFIHKRMSISIHALRVEGDTLFIAFFPSAENFYPRPPGGGRQPWSRIVSPSSKFLSTPSGWRATDYLIHDTETCKFLSTPSGWRATAVCGTRPNSHPVFLSTPSGWRATNRVLRRSGGRYDFYPRPPGGGRPLTSCITATI